METSQNTPKEDDEEDNPRSLMPVIIIPTDQDWVVVLVSFCQNFLLESVPLTILSMAWDKHSSGTLTTLDKYYNAAFFFGLSAIFTPLSCSLLNWYTFKTISVIGPTMIFLSMVSTYFAQEYFISSLFSLSFFGGFGSSLMNATSMCLPTVWFCNKRNLAWHTSRIGQSLGILLIPLFTRKVFLEYYKYSSEEIYLLYAGLYLPLIALGLAVPKLYGITLDVQDSKKTNIKVKFRDEETAATLARSMSVVGEVLSYLIFKTYHNLMFPRVKDIIRDRSVYILISDHAMTRCVDPPYRKDKPTERNHPIPRNTVSELSFSFLGVQEVQLLKSAGLPGYGSRPFYRVDIFYTADVTQLNIYYRQINQLDYHMAVSRAISRKDYQQEAANKCIVFPEAIARAFISLLHPSMWQQYYFFVLQISLALCYLGHFIPFIFTNERLLEFGYKDLKFPLINFIGVGHLVGRFYSMFSSHICYELDHSFVLMFTLVIEGCFTILSNILEHYEFQVAYSIVTGFYMSLSVSALFPAICRFTGFYSLTNAIGYVLIFQGIGIITGTLVGVYLNGQWGSVKPTFHLSGVCLVVSGLLMMPLKKLKKIGRERATDLI